MYAQCKLNQTRNGENDQNCVTGEVSYPAATLFVAYTTSDCALEVAASIARLEQSSHRRHIVHIATDVQASPGEELMSVFMALSTTTWSGSNLASAREFPSVGISAGIIQFRYVITKTAQK